MGYLKFLLIFLLELVIKNIVKTIFIIVSIISFHYAGTFPDTTDTYNVVAETKVENTYIYVCKSISDNKVQYGNIWQEGKPIEVKNGVITSKSYSGFNILFWIIFSISTLLVVIASLFMNDSDVSWNIEEPWKEAFSTLIYCEEENGEFYYFALGRLISKTDRQIGRSYRITHELRIDGFRDLYRCPKYQTKTQRRETLLNKIGIN